MNILWSRPERIEGPNLPIRKDAYICMFALGKTLIRTPKILQNI